MLICDIMTLKVFVSSNIEEFKEERKLLRQEILQDPILGRFVEPYLFEFDAAKSQTADNVFINEVEHCDIYIGLIGSQYGEIYRHDFLQQNTNMTHTFLKKLMPTFLLRMHIIGTKAQTTF